jgi:gliding motility-associated-like protein
MLYKKMTESKKLIDVWDIDGESEDGPFLGWNGEYNGHLLPSDDYWYLITLEDVRKQYTGHFTLKR